MDEVFGDEWVGFLVCTIGGSEHMMVQVASYN